MVAVQADRIAVLEAELAKHSGNSSKPPSRDTNEQRGVKKESRAERRAAGRKAGKQPGASGRHLARVADPDETVEYRPVSCGGCGGGLDGASDIGSVSRQVFDVPEINVAWSITSLPGCGVGAGMRPLDRSRSRRRRRHVGDRT